MVMTRELSIRSLKGHEKTIRYVTLVNNWAADASAVHVH